MLSALEQHFFIVGIVEYHKTVFIGGACRNSFILRLCVSLGLVQFKFRARKRLAFLVQLTYLNVIGVNKYLVTVNLALYVIFIGIGELDRIVGVTDGLGRRVLVNLS